MTAIKMSASTNTTKGTIPTVKLGRKYYHVAEETRRDIRVDLEDLFGLADARWALRWQRDSVVTSMVNRSVVDR